MNESDFEIVSAANQMAIRIDAEVVPGSFRWVRVSSSLVLPQARVRFSIRDEPGSHPMIHYLGMDTFDETTVALIPDPENPLVLLDQSGKNEIGKFFIVFRPKGQKGVSVDSSCSPFGLQIDHIKMDGSWLGMSCELLQAQSDAGAKPVLGVLLYWETRDARDLIDRDADRSPSRYKQIAEVKITADTPLLYLNKGDQRIAIHSHLASVFHRFLVNGGLGPYLNQFKGATTVYSKWDPYGTLYLAYLLSETKKIASFWALPLGTTFQVDIGLYYITEQFRIFDERLTANLLLGAHLISYRDSDQINTTVIVPQGLELNYRDFLGRGENLSVGAFFYPSVGGKAYTNTWIRLGLSKFFAEMNYISWMDSSEGFSVNSKSIGLSVGFPLLRAF